MSVATPSVKHAPPVSAAGKRMAGGFAVNGESPLKCVDHNDMPNFWALAWLAENSNQLMVPGGIATGTAGNLLGKGNISLITQVSDYYASYKAGEITKGQYDYKRKVTLDRLRKNIGPFEQILFGKRSTQQSIRIARAGGIPATKYISDHSDRLTKIAKISRGSGLA